MSELLLPSGDLNRALVSYKNGADAVYFGLKKFSARAGAENFSTKDVSKIKEYAVKNNKKFYIALNTILNDDEIDEVISMLDEIAPYSPDGIIIQDLGLFHILKKYYPSIPLHASTQLAIHTIDGVKIARDLGFKRVVLSRELSLDEIKKIRNKCSGMELEVFIHGSLCYGFSGLCFASFLKCGRSANKGECAQICRSWSKLSDGKRGYFFSMKDLFSSEEVLTLQDMEIDSLKVEGRLKSPEYCASISRYYRTLLDSHKINKEYEKDVIVSFLRSSSDGYLNYKKERLPLCERKYPGHVGLKCGKIVSVNNNKITLKSEEDVSQHDGLQYFIDKDGIYESEKFSSEIIKKENEYITLRHLSTKEDIGRDVFKISSSEKREKTYSLNIPHYKIPSDISFSLSNTSLKAESRGITQERTIKIEESKSENDFKTILEKLFRESGESKYTLNNLTYTNTSTFKMPFVPISILKSFKRDFYSLLDLEENKKTEINKTIKLLKSIELPDRHLLDDEGIPWNLRGVKIENRTYFTLPPVIFNEENIYKELEKNIKEKKNITIGINNISQIEYAKNHREFDYFIDVFLYLGNRFSAEELTKSIPNLIGGYLFIENKDFQKEWPFKPTIPSYTPPLFISRTCFKHDSLCLSCDTCNKNFKYTIENNKEKLDVIVKDCVTIVKKHK